MSRLAVLLLIFGLAGCGGSPPPQATDVGRPMRIVSLDYCADQYVLKLADREQILAISPDAVKPFSYMRETAQSVPTVRPIAENILILKPDLIVRSYGGGPNAGAFFERAGVPVLQVGWTSNLGRSGPGSIPDLIGHMADGLGQGARGEALVAEFTARLDALEQRSEGGAALYMTSSGVTTGSGSLIHEMLLKAGYENFESRPGWHAIPLERLAYEQPDLIAAAFFGRGDTARDAWSPMKHPVARHQITDKPVVPLDGAWTACGAWFILDAVEALAEGAAQ
ncbi:MAG: ABC transporter substrate-binding protein [Hyphomonadaceae bacterium]|nr:ABC transporter substrate-binding protein [Hyphomonadaceae bacterium]